jgi:hypothetical protein
MKKIKKIWHPYYNWECYNAGMYSETNYFNYNTDKCKELFKEYFYDLNNFENTIVLIFNNWNISCEHFLTWENINRIAWIGQACVCYDINLSSIYKSGFNLLDQNTKNKANKIANKYLEEWIYDKTQDNYLFKDMEKKRIY